jgi:uncharacterized membrane protein
MNIARSRIMALEGVEMLQLKDSTLLKTRNLEEAIAALKVAQNMCVACEEFYETKFHSIGGIEGDSDV